jgi:preprotein translocase subunit SecE
MATPNTASQKKKGSGKFFREVKVEMKKVIWPTKKELITYTVMVFVTVFVVMAVIAVSDGFFSQLFKLFRSIVG